MAAIMAAFLNISTTATAGLVGVAGGDAAPALTLGGFTMTPFLPDVRPEFGLVNSVPSPLGGNLGSSINLQHLLVGSGWGTWSNGYTGDAYYTDGALSLTLTLPVNTGAFYFYAEPNDQAAFNFTATAQNGTQIVQSADGNAGATYFGFFGTGGDTVQSVTISSTTDFAIGEFGIARGGVIPEPGTALFGLALLGASFARRRRG